MQLNCKVIKKWQPPISTSAPPFQGYPPLSSKILGSPSSDSIFGRSYPPLIRGGGEGGFQLCLLVWSHGLRLLGYSLQMLDTLYVTLLWKCFKNCMCNSWENWKINLIFWHAVPCFNLGRCCSKGKTR